MARPSIPVDVIGNTAQLRKQIEELSKTPVVLNLQANQLGGRGGAGISQQAGAINNLNSGLAAGAAAANSFNRPLGKISGNLTEIDKSLGAANARVIAFGASAAAIFAVQSAVQQLFTSFVNTEKKLAEINTVLKLDQGGLKGFGKQVFKTAGQTGQSFDTASEAALEFSRQGLGVEETIDRTRQALILSRLSGLDATSSVNALTAAVNSYRKESLTAGTVVNKLANVDAGFAVSSADLAEALSRVGSSASDAGVSFDELIALVTSAQQTTARGGAVIGNSLKTIFTRLNRAKTRELFGDLGISTIDDQGQEKNQIALLKDLASVYNTLGTEQKNYVAEQVGGVFQLNILKAALADLGRSFSVYDRALNTSLGTTNEAEKRNEELNKTLAGLGTQTAANVQSAVSTIGEGLFAPAAKNVLNIANFLATSVNESESSGVGAELGKGLVNGLGSFLAGPGLAIIGAVLAKLFADFAKYGTTAAQSLLGLDKASKNQAAIQQSVSAFLQKNVGLYASIANGQTSATAAAKQYLSIINQQTAALQSQAAIAKSVSAAVIANIGKSGAGTSAIATTGRRPTRFAGFIPNFAAMSERDYYQSAENAGAKSHKGGYRASILKGVTVHDGLGNSERAWMTSRESKKTFTNAAGYKATMITPPNGFGPNTMVASAGFIPNFAKKEKKQNRTVGGLNFGWLHAGSGYGTSNLTAWDKRDGTEINASWAHSGLKKELNFEGDVVKDFTPPFQKLVNRIAPTPTSVGTINQYMDKSAWPQFLGRAFESAVIGAVYGMTDVSGEGGGKGFDVPSVDQMKFGKVFANVAGFTTADIKKSPPGNKPSAADPNVSSFINKLMAKAGYGGGYKNNLSNVPPDKETLKSNKDKALAKQAMIAAQGNVTLKQVEEYSRQRAAALDRIRKEGVILTKKELEARLKSEIGPNLTALRNKQQSAFRRPGRYSGFIPHFAPNIAAIQRLITQGATSGERQAAIAAMQRIQSSALSKLGSTDKLAKFRELLYGSKSNAGFNLDAIRIKDFKYGPLVAGAKELGLTMKDLEMLSANPMAINQLRMLQTGAKSGYFSAGFIPNFASQIKEMQDRALRTEKSYGKGATLDEYKGMQYVRQPGQSSNFKTMMKQDHPEGLKAAMQNSAAAQGLSGGFIPNFAPEDDSSAQSAAIAASIQSLLFTLAFTLPNRDAMSEGIKDVQKQEIRTRQEALKKSKLLSKKETFEKQKELIRSRAIQQAGLRSMGLTSQEAFVSERKKLAQQLRATNNDFKTSTNSINKSFERLDARTAKLIDEGKIRPGIGQRLTGASRAFGPGGMIGAAMAAPILGETIASGFGRETTEGRTIGAAGQGLGYLAAGAAIGGVPGAIIGGLVGAASTYNEYSRASTSNLAKTGKDAEKAIAEASRVNDLIQTAMSQAADYFDNQAQGNTKQADKAQESVMETIAKFGSKNSKRLVNAFYEGQDRFAEEMSAVSKETRSEEIEKNAINAFESVASELRFSQKDIGKRFLAGFGFGGATISKEQLDVVSAAMQSLLFGDLRGKDLIKAVESSGDIASLTRPISSATEELFKNFKKDALEKGVGQAYFDTEGDVGLAERLAKNMGADIGGKELSDSAKKFVDSFNNDMAKFKQVIESLSETSLTDEQFLSVAEIFKNFSSLDKVVTEGILKPIIEARETSKNIQQAAKGETFQQIALRNFGPVQAQAGKLESPVDVLQNVWQKRLEEMMKKSKQMFESEQARQKIIADMMKGLNKMGQFDLELPRDTLFAVVREQYNSFLADMQDTVLISQTGEKTNALEIIKNSVPNYSEIIIARILKDLGIVDTKDLQEKTEDINRRIQEFLSSIRVTGKIGDKTVITTADGRTAVIDGSIEEAGGTRSPENKERIERMIKAMLGGGGGAIDTDTQGEWLLNKEDIERLLKGQQTSTQFYNTIIKGANAVNSVINKGGGGRPPLVDEDFVNNVPGMPLKEGSFYETGPSILTDGAPFNLNEPPIRKNPRTGSSYTFLENGEGWLQPNMPMALPSFLGEDVDAPKFDLDPDYIVESFLADTPLFNGPRTSLFEQKDFFGRMMLDPNASNPRMRPFMLQPNIDRVYPNSFPYREPDVPLTLNPPVGQPTQPLIPTDNTSIFSTSIMGIIARSLTAGAAGSPLSPSIIPWPQEDKTPNIPLDINTLTPTVQNYGEIQNMDESLNRFPQEHETILDRSLQDWENAFRNINQPTEEPLAPVSDLSSLDVLNGLRVTLDRFMDKMDMPDTTQPTFVDGQMIPPKVPQNNQQPSQIIDVQAPITATVTVSTDIADDVVTEFNEKIISQSNVLRTEIQAGIAQLRREIPSIVRSII